MNLATLLALTLYSQESQGEPWLKQESALRVEMDKVWPTPTEGYPFPLRVRIENLGQAREIECFVRNLYGKTWTVSRRFPIAIGERAQFSLLVPAFQSYIGVEVHVDGKRIDDLTSSMHSNSPSNSSPFSSHLIIDGRKDYSQAQIEISFPLGQHPVFLPAHRLSDQWQAYMGLQAVWARASEWKALLPADRDAILRAVKAGQTLVFYETGDAPLIGTDGLIPAEAAAGWTAPIGKSEGVRFGLGRLFRVTGTLIGQPNLAQSFGSDVRALPHHPFLELARWHIPGVSTVTPMTFFWIVFFFALLIGPINLFFVRRLRKPILFMVTTPLIAIFSISTLFAYSILRDGFAIKASIHSFTLLNPEAHESVTVATTGFYSGMATGIWRYRPATLCLNLGEPKPYRIDWSRGQEVSGFPPRNLNVVATLQVIPDRARLLVEKVAGRILIHNGLGSAIVEGVLRGEEGFLSIPAIPSGGSANGEPVGNTEAFPWFSQDPSSFVPGEFLVRTSANTAVDQGGKTLEELEGLHMIRGQVTEQK
jgi:hypothetical protein